MLASPRAVGSLGAMAVFLVAGFLMATAVFVVSELLAVTCFFLGRVTHATELEFDAGAIGAK